MKKIVLLGFLCLFLIYSAFGQEQRKRRSNNGVADRVLVDDDANTTKLGAHSVRLPPSPTASSLAKFIDVPVSYFTGAAEVSIPLLDITEKELAVNVSLSYHASGLRVDDIAGWVGTGWALNTGGVITRTVRGRPDELQNGFLTKYDQIQYIAGNFATLDLNQYHGILEEYESGSYDSEPDVFFFSCGGYSGKFHLAPNGKIVMLPFQKIDITVQFDGSSHISGFLVKTPNGTKYNFNVSERNTTQIPNGGSPDPYNSAWYLGNIQSKNGYSITFEYEEHALKYKTNVSASHIQGSSSGCAPGQEFMTVSNTTVFNAKKIKKILSSNGYAEFFTSYDRQDLANLTDDKKLDRVELRNASGGLVKSFQLNYGYFNAYNGNKRLKLTSVKELGDNGCELPGHVFTYDETNVPPQGSFAQDRWGFYNGKTQNSVLYPAMNNYIDPINPNTPLPGADRSTDVAYLQGGILKKITYPGGGSTSFEYEPHAATFDGVFQSVGGLRVKRIIHDNLLGNSFRKVFSYEQPTIGYVPRYDYVQSTKVIGPSQNECRYLVRSATGTSAPGTGEHIFYGKVTELGDENGVNGKTEYTFELSPNSAINAYPYGAKTDNSWKNGLIKEKNIAKSGSSVLKEITNYTTDAGQPEVTANAYSMKGFKIGKNHDVFGLFSGNNNLDYVGKFFMDPMDVFSRWLYVRKTTNNIYDENDQAKVNAVVKDIYYENATHAQITKTVTTDSKGASVETTYKYPQDFASSAPYNEMVSNFIIDPIIEQQEKVGGSNTHYTRTDFEKINNLYLPKRTKTRIGAGTEYEEMVVDTYDDRGNITQYRDKSGIITKLDWHLAAGKKDLMQNRILGYGTSMAQTISYDYKPMVGMSLEVDASNRSIYYNYDNFSRLLDIRENAANGNLLKSFVYKYGSVAGCTTSGALVTTTPNVTAPATPGLTGGCTPPAAPTINNPSGSTTVCAATNTSVTLTATNYTGTITWFKDGSTFATNVASIAPTQPGTYTASYVSTAGCTSNISTAVVLTQAAGCTSGGALTLSIWKAGNSTTRTKIQDLVEGAQINLSAFGGSQANWFVAVAGQVTNSGAANYYNQIELHMTRTGSATEGWGPENVGGGDGGPYGLYGRDGGVTPVTGTYSINAKSWYGTTQLQSKTINFSIVSCAAPAAPTLSAPGTTVCAASGTSVVITASNYSGGTLTWYKNGAQIATNVTSITRSDAGSYTVTTTIAGGCTSAQSSAVTLTQSANCGGTCYELSLASNSMRLSNHNGLVKVKNSDNTSSQIWKIESAGSGYVKLVSQGGTNAGYVLGVRSQGLSEGNPVDLQASATGDHQLWLQTAMSGADAGRYKFERKGTTLRMGSTRNWGGGILGDGESDITITADPTDAFGANKWVLTTKTCPN